MSRPQTEVVEVEKCCLYPIIMYKPDPSVAEFDKMRWFPKNDWARAMKQRATFLSMLCLGWKETTTQLLCRVMLCEHSSKASTGPRHWAFCLMSSLISTRGASVNATRTRIDRHRQSFVLHASTPTQIRVPTFSSRSLTHWRWPSKQAEISGVNPYLSLACADAKKDILRELKYYKILQMSFYLKYTFS